jgi:hypothetical protein
MAQEPDLLAPLQPETIDQTGLPESTIEHLVLKILYFRGDLYGQELSTAIGLKFSVIHDVVESLKLQHLIQVKRSLGMGNVGSVFALTEAGRGRARDCLESNHYSGPAPVPLDQYADMVRRQKLREGWLTKEALAKALRGLVVTERLLSQIGPAISSANSLLLYGKPGDGKTFLIESLANLDTAPIFLPYALECQGNIVQLFDPIYHERVAEEEDEPSVFAVSEERTYDKRWAKCKRPFIVSGGELTLDMLDLRYNAASKVYEAPYQLKANNGIYLIDDFGRQRATPSEVLNRWIVPMERRVDYMSFLTGGKMTAPFEAFLVFSTNLNPADLGDEAFLRRMQYKLLLRSPAENEFIRIFESFCTTRRIPCSRDLIKWFVDKYYKQGKKPFRRCHPRDVLGHALNLIHFEKLPVALTAEVLDRAFESCFLQEADEKAPVVVEAPILPVVVKSCADFWGDKVALITTAFGSLMFTASFRDRSTGKYHEPQSDRQYGEAETSRVLHRLHQRAFLEWLAMTVTQQSRDLARFLASAESTSAKVNLDPRELLASLPPAEARPEELNMFTRDLGPMLDQAWPRTAADILTPVAAPVAIHAAPIERIA